MRIISFNLNGIQSMLGKVKNGQKIGSPQDNVIKSLIDEQQPDILCFQEIKTQNRKLVQFDYPHIYTNTASNKKGYSGTVIMSRIQPRLVSYDFDWMDCKESFEFEEEGRVITCWFETYIVICVYVPNSKDGLTRLEERIEWEKKLRLYLTELEIYQLPIILCGDLNIASTEIDIYCTKGKHKLAGYSPEERTEFKKLLEIGFIDSFRHLYPDTRKYTYWSNFYKAREKNNGWRIDYCLVSQSVEDKITHADCLTEYMGSDHCPVVVDITI